MAHLSDEALFGATVPASWEPLLKLVGLLEALLTEHGEAPPTDASRARAAWLRSDLVTEAARLAEETPPTLRAGSPQHKRWFTEAVLLWTRYGESGGPILIDTLGSTTVSHFHPDVPDDVVARDKIREALRRTFGWSVAELADLEHGLQARTSNLTVKRAISGWIAEHLADQAERPRRIAVLASRIYGPLPLRPGDVDLVLTSTSVLVCFPFEGTTLVRPDLAERSPADQAALVAFLETIQKYKNSFDTIRFPAFGVYDRKAVDPALIATLTDHCKSQPGLEGINETVVSETLATMVTIVPSLDAEKFLVHDIWGHGWEESLCDFEWSYQQLLDLREPIGPQTGARWGSRPLRDCFVVVGDRVVLDREAFKQCIATDLRGRITVGLNVVLAECLADLVEHKYGRQRGEAPELPSSSQLPRAPLKLDLSLRDTQMLLKASHRSYRRLLEKPDEAGRLVGDLTAAGLPTEGLVDAVMDAIHLVRDGFAGALETKMAVLPAEGAAISVDLSQRVVLGIVALDAALDRYLAEAGEVVGPPWQNPRASIDLLVLFLAWCYEQDRSVNFWHLDELVRHELGETMARFQGELHAVLGLIPG
jgi:hypothetical protein